MKIIGAILWLIGGTKLIQSMINFIIMVIVAIVLLLITLTFAIIKGGSRNEESNKKNVPVQPQIIININRDTPTNNVKVSQVQIPQEEFSPIAEILTPFENNKPDSKDDKLYKEMGVIEWVLDLIKYIIYLMVKIVLIIIIILMSLILAAIAIKLLTEYVKNQYIP